MLSFVNVLSFVSESKDPGVLSQSLNWNGIPNDARRARYRPCSKVDTVGKSCRACCVISGRHVPFVRIRKDAASPRAVHLRADSECRPRRPGGSGSSRGAVPVDETCPISTEGWTRRVHFVREGGGSSGRLTATVAQVMSLSVAPDGQVMVLGCLDGSLHAIAVPTPPNPPKLGGRRLHRAPRITRDPESWGDAACPISTG